MSIFEDELVVIAHYAFDIRIVKKIEGERFLIWTNYPKGRPNMKRCSGKSLEPQRHIISTCSPWK